MNGHSLMWLVLVSSRVYPECCYSSSVRDLIPRFLWKKKTLTNESKKILMQSGRIELMTFQTPNLHAAMALPGTHRLERQEREEGNSLLTEPPYMF